VQRTARDRFERSQRRLAAPGRVNHFFSDELSGFVVTAGIGEAAAYILEHNIHVRRDAFIKVGHGNPPLKE
jgi:hypothetical protein